MYSGILLYTVIWIVSCLIVRFHYDRQIALNFGWDERDDGYVHTIKMPIVSALVIAGLFTLFNVYATMHSVSMGADRRNYALNFSGYRPTPSIGLRYVMDFVHWIGGDLQTLFYITTFVCVFITLMAYRLSKKASPYVFYLLCVTQYFLSTLVHLKQCYASALAVLFFVLMLEYNSKKSRLAAIVCVAFACLFHPTGYLLIPMYIIFAAEKSKRNVALYALLLLIIGLFLDRFMLWSAMLLKPAVPSLASKLLQYYGNIRDVTQEGMSYSFLKGVPYYIIVLIGLFKRRDSREKIEHYDDYLIIVGTGAFLYMVSVYNSWFGRFIYFFCFVTFTFFLQLLKTMESKEDIVLLNTAVQISLIFFTYRFLYLVYEQFGGF